ncbi:enoyl-CoA hydratase/isomerase family protein [Ottowia sp. GY511]|uniref:Enoyl-CoA hydratase/isomerase family protein n=1 Tax=Ottowia flava TaxID=2675430 RepID=A0ABW4KU70_9BURK|nr:enoyl-CoA hydratase/isomerase family protein [Ottowia sp. GY511]TXK22461.1 enoyl-CoA hydratase/isomerase family protein [Ottowia sp. GY511]
MSGEVVLTDDGALAIVELTHPGKYNAMSRAMWRQLAQVFGAIQAGARWRCVLLRGADGHFCSGGDIAEYPDFRFDRERLRGFHEDEVWGGLQAVIDCDVPIVAAIAGHCMGAGIEMASACDIRVAADNAKFGAPIAKLGFPMAPREAALVAGALGEATAREMLLEAAVLGAPEMQRRGFLNATVPVEELMAHARTRAERMAALSPQAARLNKQTLRALKRPQAQDGSAQAAMQLIVESAYDYADSPGHREGIEAFLAKRPARFQ